MRDWYAKETYGDATLIQYAMTQVSTKRGIEQWGKGVVKAMLKELEHFLMKKIFRPLDPSGMTEQEKADSLEHMLFLNDKKYKNTKERGCADGRKQQAGSNKRDAT